jgi:hypothetical protein
MNSLRGKLIRLAYTRPDLRDKILPLVTNTQIKVAAKKSVVFAEAVLEKPEILTNWLSQQTNAPSLTGWDIKAHHMTIEFFGNKGSAENLKPYKNIIGKTFNVKIKGYVADDKAIAVVLDLPSGLPSKNKHPHITVAVNKGTSPAYSNELIESSNLIPARGSLELKVGYFSGGADMFEVPVEISDK